MEDTAVRIFWAADSTVQTNDITTYPQTGIGQVFSLYTREGVVLSNHAKNGRSTKSFMDEGRLAVIEGQIGAGDFLFIQFGHNDEKREDPARYTEPFSTFMENLETYINAARKHHAHPVLITPLERRCFVDARHLGMGAHSDYVAAMKQTAEKNRVPLVDLYSMSRCALKSAGEPDSRSWYMYFDAGVYKNYPEGKTDNTHLRYEGAVRFAGMIARGLRDLGGIYADLLLDGV
ncbi:MAG: rhamnogalacturonan acetylesterase [Lachnospiraceae bacterium]|jgi:lysophospholipase L1-like esterase|nr:rhamnogalacturonan acetylesterase [Lachnospiraceae bacterium]MDE6941247.1 rhamnogalacturonan acetylesterase [Lachnospiraceae bacterium]MDE7001912.1 rhamnogalacturonan acetylesterase [Lachnospiraceae bacterium]